MEVTVGPSTLQGKIKIPASKSAMQRACAAALLLEGNTILQSYGKSKDDQAALAILQQLGVSIFFENEQIIIQSKGLYHLLNPSQTNIHCGASGLSTRMFAPILALSPRAFTLTGEGSLLQRPLTEMENFFPALGVNIQTQNSYLPIHIQGPLKAKDIIVNGQESSQYITGLLLALSSCKEECFSLQINQAKSTPYIDLTLEIMSHFGMRLPEKRNASEYYFGTIERKNRSNEIVYKVEGDWSAAAFWLVAGAVFGAVKVEGLKLDSTQGDKAILTVLQMVGAGISIEENSIEVRPQSLNPFAFDATHCPDLFPPLVALAAYTNGVSVINGVHRLIHKESNRAEVLKSEFGKLGLDIQEINDSFVIRGGAQLQGGTVESYQDHRIAMALAIAALGAKDKVKIMQAEAVEKSYPDFFEDLKSLQNLS